MYIYIYIYMYYNIYSRRSKYRNIEEIFVKKKCFYFLFFYTYIHTYIHTYTTMVLQ